jgi:hypothetical protein
MPELTFPTKGKHVGSPASKQPPQTSRDLNNVRPYFDGRSCGGQRDGANKRYSQQVGGDSKAVVAMCSVTVVD